MNIKRAEYHALLDILLDDVEKAAKADGKIGFWTMSGGNEEMSLGMILCGPEMHGKVHAPREMMKSAMDGIGFLVDMTVPMTKKIGGNVKCVNDEVAHRAAGYEARESNKRSEN